MKVATLFGFLGVGISSFAQPLEWETVHPSPGLPELRHVAFGEGRSIAVPARSPVDASTGPLYFSADSGATWQTAGAPDGAYAGIVYGGSRFVAVMYNGGIAVSEDGITWESSWVTVTASLLTVTYGDGLYVVTGGNGFIATSPDARNWTVRNESFGQPALERSVFGNGRFIAISVGYGADSFAVAISTNGTNWTFETSSLPTVEPGCIPQLGRPCAKFDRLIGLTFAENRFVALASYGLIPGTTATKILTSPDGINWTVNTGSSPGTGNQIAFNGAGNNLYYVNGRYFHVSIPHVATNLNEWSALPLSPYSPPELFGTGPSFQSVAYGNGFYVLAGGSGGWARIARSANLTDWERLDTPRTGINFPTVQRVAAIGQTIAAITANSSQPLIISTNGGETFANVSAPAGSGTLKDLHAAQGAFVAVGTGGTILRSIDGLNWTKRLSNTSSDLNRVTFGNGLWVAVGQGGTIVTSPDASFFTLSSPNTQVNLRGVTYGNGLYLAVGDTGAILRSTNAVNWTIFGTEQASDLNAVVFDGGLFVAVGTNGIVHYSGNGTTWSVTGVSANNLLDVAAANGRFVAGAGVTAATLQDSTAVSTSIFVSSNGVNWTQQTMLRPVYGIGSSGGTLWVTGEAGYIARRKEAPAGIIQINPQRSASGLFGLNFIPPTPGNYEILDTPILGGTWAPVTVLTNPGARAIWTDTRPMQGNRWYIVRKVPAQ